MVDGIFCKQFLAQHKKLFEKTAKIKYKDVYEYIINHTQFLDDTYNFSDRKYCILHDITELPKCIVCGKPTRLYKKCCCDECVKIYNKSPECISKKINKTKQLHGNDCFVRKKTKLEYLSQQNTELYNNLMSIKWLPIDASYNERMWCYKHSIIQQPLCIICGKPTHFINGYGYTKTCCDDCKNIFVSRKLISKSAEEWENINEKRKLSLTDQTKQTANIKRKQTCVLKYGGIAPSCCDEIKEKIKQTCISKYGVDNIFKNKEYIKQKINEKYGVDNIFKKSEYIIKKQIEKFGSVISQKHLSAETIKIINDKQTFIKYIADNNVKSVNELCDKLSISDFCALKYLKKYDQLQLLNRNISHYEDEITKWLQDRNIQTVNNKRILNGKEIDIYLPDFKIGIEFNGNYWHSDINKTKLYHQQKSLLAKQNNIFLYHIFEYEWNLNKDKILNHLSNILNLSHRRIYARQCKIVEIDNKICSKFLDKYHMQGSDSSSIKLGLFLNDELLMVMTFCKPRFNNKYEWELSRLCTISGVNVLGGSSKLFAYFIRKYNPQNIISYSNYSKNTGKVYLILGFSHIELSVPNYVWCDGYNILSRYQTQKHKLISEGYNGNTETEIMNNRGYYKIYDCGNDVWLWEANKKETS